jgi:hypothetical protein
MKILKVCEKCKARYLLFHLDSDCKFVREKFEMLRDIFKKTAIDDQLGKKWNKEDFERVIPKASGMQDNLDEKASFIEWSRCISFPSLSILISFALGVIFLTFTKFEAIAGILVISSILLFFLEVVFLVQGGFNWLFKEMIIYDLLRRYKIRK